MKPLLRKYDVLCEVPVVEVPVRVFLIGHLDDVGPKGAVAALEAQVGVVEVGAGVTGGESVAESGMGNVQWLWDSWKTVKKKVFCHLI